MNTEKDWKCSLEKMICYFIEANKTITDSKEKNLANYIVAVRKQVNTRDYNTIADSINTLSFNKYFTEDITQKWKKINGKHLTNYAALVFNQLLLDFGTITQDKIVKATKDIIESYTSETDIINDSLKLLLNNNID
jgi:hypothetical protein